MVNGMLASTLILYLYIVLLFVLLERSKHVFFFLKKKKSPAISSYPSPCCSGCCTYQPLIPAVFFVQPFSSISDLGKEYMNLKSYRFSEQRGWRKSNGSGRKRKLLVPKVPLLVPAYSPVPFPRPHLRAHRLPHLHALYDTLPSHSLHPTRGEENYQQELFGLRSILYYLLIDDHSILFSFVGCLVERTLLWKLRQ